MKIFNTLQELWDHCLFCPLCQKDTRTIDLSVGPDPNFECLGFLKENHLLTIQCRNKKKNCLPIYQINCDNNTYQVEIKDRPYPDHCVTINPNEDTSRYFYFWINASCQNCHHTWVSTLDVEFESVNGNIFNTGLEQECISLFRRDIPEYQITLDFFQDVTVIYKLDDYTPRKLVLKLPLTTWDYSDQDSLIDKIKTYILFS
jgi:hypothetical protein